MTAARRFVLSGRVQGVGFRPFVFRLAHELGLAGTVRNGAGRVFIAAEGPRDALDAFAARLVADAPPLAVPVLDEQAEAEPAGFGRFAILRSEDGETPDISVPPDLFMCDDCLEEMTGPGERRFGYPFINCTQCGPRYTLIARMPYDRPNTAMADFPLCDACRAEYENPLDRRFHAQPLACPVCGPHLTFVAGDRRIAGDDAAIAAAVASLGDGGIVAVKGVGGYHLMCDALNEITVEKLRQRKRRPDKPLAVMVPFEGERGLDAVMRFAEPSPEEAGTVANPQRPIVLMKKRRPDTLVPGIAPGLREVGIFLPYAPLHHLLLGRFGAPLVATSGNVSGEPVIVDNTMAEARLGGVADAFLHHDRPIVRPADDTVLRLIAGAPRIVRAGRGLAPVELRLPVSLPCPVVAAGGHMKNTVALGFGDRAVSSPHIGELDAPRARDVFERVASDLQDLYAVRAEAIATDFHPGYWSTRWAQRQGLPVIEVGHHAAHASALAAEHPEVESWLAFAWDGVGLGPDGTLWGGEALHGRPGAWQRVGSFRPFHVAGGDRAGREPWRSAAALMWEDGRGHETGRATALARSVWEKRINTFATSAAGRLFDAAAALVLGIETVSFEGQGPMLLEAIADPAAAGIRLPLAQDDAGIWRTDWVPLLDRLADRRMAPRERAGMFHASLAAALVDQATALARHVPFQAVGLTGGVFQNRLLGEMVTERLKALEIEVHMPRMAPANDGGLAFGQLVEAAAILAKEDK